MVNKKFFQKLKKANQNFDFSRRLIIGQSNIVLHKAKQAVFCLHRDQIFEAGKRLKEAEDILIKISPRFSKAPDLKYSGAYKASLEEYLEAKLFYQVLRSGEVGQFSKIKVSFDDYLAALCDLTGEINRKIVLLATGGKFRQAEGLKELIADIISGLIQIDLTGYLRHKFDEAKRNLKKAEEVIYDLRVRRS